MLELDALGILSVLDRAVLTRYCRAWAYWLELRRVLDREGLVLTSERYGARKHPAWQMYREAGTMLDQAAASCGMSPAARQRMARSAPPPDPDDDEILD